MTPFATPRHPHWLNHILTIVVVLLLGACAPRQNSALERAQMNLLSAHENQNVMRYSPHLVAEADALYHQAEHEWQTRGEPVEIDHLVYLSNRKLDIAREDASRRMALELASMHRDSSHDAAVDIRSQQLVRRQIQSDSNDRARITQGFRERENQMLVEQLRQDVAALQARESARGLELTITDDVLFDSGESGLKRGAVLSLQPLISFLRDHPERRVTIEGHTDNVGGDRYNRELSRQRALSVRELFLTAGLRPEQVLSRGFGDDYPVATNATVAGRLQNRRVEIIISGQG